MRRAYAFAAAGALALGVSVYLLFRDLSGLALSKWLGIPWKTDRPIIGVNPEGQPVAAVLAGSLPDLCWFLCGVFVIRSVWFSCRKWCGRYACSFGALAVLWELAQLHEGIPGVFDPWDMAFIVMAVVVEGGIYNFCIRRIFYETK
jgi:hypothetical protein